MEGKKKLRTGGPARHRWIFPAAAPLPATQVSSKTSRQQTSLTNPTKSWHALPWNGLLCAKVLFIDWYFFFWRSSPKTFNDESMNPFGGLIMFFCFFPRAHRMAKISIFATTFHGETSLRLPWFQYLWPSVPKVSHTQKSLPGFEISRWNIPESFAMRSFQVRSRRCFAVLSRDRISRIVWNAP